MTDTPTKIQDAHKESVLARDAKKVMTSFDLQAMRMELESTILGARIENIYQFSPTGFLITTRRPGNLILEVGRRIHLTNYQVEKPAAPSLFCSILRRHLRQGVIEEVAIDDFERVLHFTVSSKEDLRKLVVEVFGGGNLLLLDERDVIVQALTYRRMRDRNIIRGEIYKLPPSRGVSPVEATPSILSSLRTQKGDVAKALGRMLSIGSPYVEEILVRAKIEKTHSTNELIEDNIQAIFQAVQNLIEDLKKPRPRIIIEDSGGWLDVVPFPLLQYGAKASIEFGTFNEAADVYFTRLSTELGGAEKVAEGEARVEEQKRILEQQHARLKELEIEVSASQRSGDLLYIHFSEVQEVLDRLRRGEVGFDQSVTVFFNASNRKVRVRLDGQEIELDVRLSVHENAKSFYERTKDARQKMEGLRQAIVEAEKRFKEREASAASISKKSPRIIHERAWYEKFYWAKSKSDALMIGGRDATTNELLIKKYMEPKDIVFHTDDPGAPFVLTKPQDEEVNENDIPEAAQMAGSYSSAWKAKVTSTDVYWVKPEQVSKEAPSGEYLTRGAFMIRGQKNYVRNVQLRISIGLIELQEGLQVIGGPMEAIKAQTKIVVDIVPGRLSSGALAKEIRRRLASKRLEQRQMVLAIPLEEIQRFIPPGGGELAVD